MALEDESTCCGASPRKRSLRPLTSTSSLSSRFRYCSNWNSGRNGSIFSIQLPAPGATTVSSLGFRPNGTTSGASAPRNCHFWPFTAERIIWPPS